MSFWKAFLFSLLTLIGSNLLMIFILYVSFGRFNNLMVLYATYPTNIIYNLFCSMGHAIWVSVQRIAYGVTYGTLFGLLEALIILIVPLITAIVAGRVGKKRLYSFLGVFLTSIISMIVSVFLMFDTTAFQFMIASEIIGNGALFIVFGGSLLNGLIFGFIAYITTKRE